MRTPVIYENGDSLLNRKEIIRQYKEGKSLRQIARYYDTNHHTIKRVLIHSGIDIRPRKANQTKHNSKKMSVYSKIANRIRFDVKAKWFSQFSDLDKIKFLNRQISNRDHRFDVSSEWYTKYIIKFYHDDTFNRIYRRYINSGNNKYLKPSLDHIIPRSLGGTNELSNLRFITYFENMCKRNIPSQEWDEMKKNITMYFS